MIKLGHWWFELPTCPNSKLGQWSSWGTGGSNFQLAPIPNQGNGQVGAPVVRTPNLPQFQTGAMFKLGHRWFELPTCPNSKLGQWSSWGTGGSNFQLAPIPNWGNGQVGAPVVQTPNLPQFQ